MNATKKLLEEESGKRNLLVPKTLRVPREILIDIQNFIRLNPRIKESAILRISLLRGWESLKAELDHDG
jgi:hypothetical protein